MSATPADHVVEFLGFGKRVRVRTDDAGLAGYLARQWGNTPGDLPAQDAPVDLAYRVVRDPPRIETGGREVPLDPDLFVLHAYGRIVSELLASVDRAFVFHASVVADDDGALLVSGPSTFGKSTLSLHLALSGLRWVADDVGILDRASRAIVPFDRPVRLRPGARATLTSAARGRALAARIAEEGEDWIARPDAWLEVESRPVPLRTVIILRPGEDGAGLRRFPILTVRLRGAAAALGDELGGLPGVANARRGEDDPARFELEVHDPVAVSGWLARHADDVVYAVKFAASAADFDGRPGLARISGFQAALELCQEMQNRREGSLLAREYAGRETDLVADVAEAIGNARCHALTPGGLEETVALVRAAHRRG